MKIVHIVDFFHPEMGYQENHLSRLQANAGHTVWVLTSDRLTPWPNESLTRVRDGDAVLASLGVNVCRLPARFEYSHRVWLRDLGTRLLEISPDYIHVHSFASINAFRVARLMPRLACTLVVDDHMLYVASRNRFRAIWRPLFKLLLTRTVCGAASAIVPVTDETARYLVEVYGVPKDKLTVILLAASTDDFFPSREKRQAKRSAMGLADTDKLFLYTGKMEPIKNPIVALYAARRLRDMGYSFRFAFVGRADPTYLANMRKYVSENQLEELVTFYDAVPTCELADYFNAADVAVWPTNCTMSSLEAMACGCPVILADLPINCERVGPGGGVVFADGDWEDLASKMLHLLMFPPERAKLAMAAAEGGRVWNWRNVNERFMELAGM